MVSANMTILDLLKIKVFWNKVYGVIISVHDVTKKISSHDSNYLVDVVMWPKFGISRISLVFHWWHWFKFNNLGMALSTNLKFYSSVAKWLKLKVRKISRLIPTFVEVTGEELVGRPFCHPPPPLPPLSSLNWNDQNPLSTFFTQVLPIASQNNILKSRNLVGFWKLSWIHVRNLCNFWSIKVELL